VGISRDCPNFLSTPIISGTGKATNFKFCTNILSIDRNKSPLQISGKVAGCVVRTLETFLGTHLLGASRGLLCDSSAVLLLNGHAGIMAIPEVARLVRMYVQLKQQRSQNVTQKEHIDLHGNNHYN